VYCNLRSMAEGITPCYTISGSTDPADWGEVPTNTNSTWNSVTCNWSVNGYRLPSEAEWEYAARGGTNWTDNCRYSGCVNEADLTNYVWYYGNYTGPCHPVGTKAPNQLGIYDMNGNVWEWCWDWYGKSYYTACNDLGIVTDPYGPDIGSRRDARGGYWNSAADDCRIAVRYYYGPSFRSLYSVGFRVSRTP
ncbi:MAG: formylglycine-generating enzyme family protein, partial [Candidatus Delongbacteria bacterium]|nr:formylglycine-generating enzyme family protein [Candidatus Delongbacteria bacterium]